MCILRFRGLFQKPLCIDTYRYNHAYIFVYIVIHVYIDTHIHVHLITYTYTYIYLHMYMCVCLHISTNTDAHMYMCVYIYTYMCLHIKATLGLFRGTLIRRTTHEPTGERVWTSLRVPAFVLHTNLSASSWNRWEFAEVIAPTMEKFIRGPAL